MTSTGGAPFLYISDMHSIHAWPSVVKRKSKKRQEEKIPAKPKSAARQTASQKRRKKTQDLSGRSRRERALRRRRSAAAERRSAAFGVQAVPQYHSFASAAESSIRTASTSGAETVLQISARRNAPIRAVPPSGAQAAPCKRRTYSEYKKLSVNAAPQPMLYNLAIKHIFRTKKVKDVSGAADARNGAYMRVFPSRHPRPTLRADERIFTITKVL